jgi:hypothetical protein
VNDQPPISRPSRPGVESQPPTPAQRDGQHRSPFTAILEALCGSCAGSLAAAIADEEGECVDLATAPTVGGAAPLMPAYLVKLCAAHWQIVMAQLPPRAVRQLWIEADKYGYVVKGLHHGYVLVLVCRPPALATVSWRALRQCEVELALEAGWPVRDEGATCWVRTRAELDAHGRPRAVWLGRRWIGDLGLVEQARGPKSFERAYKSTAPGSLELELVREPTGLWYLGCSLALMKAARSDASKRI